MWVPGKYRIFFRAEWPFGGVLKPADHSFSEPFIGGELFKVGTTTVTPTTPMFAAAILLLSYFF